MTTHTPTTYSFDGKGINGADEYRSRLATLTDEGHKQKIGPLFAASPEILEALEALVRMAEMIQFLTKGDPVIAAKFKQAQEALTLATKS